MQYLLLGINIVLLVLGQVMWKIAAEQILFEISYKGIVSWVFNMYFIIGCLLYVAATGFWIYLLSQKQLSDIYPLQSICYPLAALVGILFFKESISFIKSIGLLFILFGAICINVRL